MRDIRVSSASTLKVGIPLWLKCAVRWPLATLATREPVWTGCITQWTALVAVSSSVIRCFLPLFAAFLMTSQGEWVCRLSAGILTISIV